MAIPRLTLRNVELRSVSIPLKRPIVSKVGRFDRWPLVLIDLHTEEGIVGRSYLEPYLERRWFGSDFVTSPPWGILCLRLCGRRSGRARTRPQADRVYCTSRARNEWRAMASPALGPSSGPGAATPGRFCYLLIAPIGCAELDPENETVG